MTGFDVMRELEVVRGLVQETLTQVREHRKTIPLYVESIRKAAEEGEKATERLADVLSGLVAELRTLVDGLKMRPVAEQKRGWEVALPWLFRLIVAMTVIAVGAALGNRFVEALAHSLAGRFVSP